MAKKDTRLASGTITSVGGMVDWEGKTYALLNFKREGVHMYVPDTHPLANLNPGTTVVFVKEENT
jgi:hypothetical protein